MSEQPVAEATPEATPAAVIDPPPSPSQVVADVVADTEKAATDTAAGAAATFDAVKADLHPAVAEVLQFFDPSHLPAELAAVAAPFRDLAHKIAGELRGSQLTLALHSLLASKDAAVRAKVAENNAAAPTA